MKFSEKLLKNYECGKMTVVRRDDGKNCIFSTLDCAGDLACSSWYELIEMCMANLGRFSGFDEVRLNEYAEEESWQIVKTIDFSELGGEGYKVGDKVRVIATGEIGYINSFFGGGYFVGPDPHYRLESVSTFRHPKEIEPYFEEEYECEEAPTMNLSERLDMIDRKIGIIFEELGITELKCGILSKKKS